MACRPSGSTRWFLLPSDPVQPETSPVPRGSTSHEHRASPPSSGFAYPHDVLPHGVTGRQLSLVGPVVATFLAFVTVVLVPGLALGVLLMAREGPSVLFDRPRLETQFGQAALSFAGLSVVVLANAAVLSAIALVGAALSTDGLAGRLGLGRSRVSWPVVLGLAVGILGLSQALDALTVLLGLSTHGVLPKLRQAMRNLGSSELAVLTAVMAVGPGFGEEFLFRGYIQRGFVQRLGPGPGVGIAAALFGALHLDPVQGPMAAILGLYLGHVAWRTGSLWPAVICHGVNNAVATLSGARAPESLGGTLACGVQVVGGLAIALAALLLLERRVGQGRTQLEAER